MVELSREPILSGDFYCSPACGGRCRRSAYETAVAKADALVRELGPGWEPRVWENLGWHAAASYPNEQKTRVEVHGYPGQWRAYLHNVFTGSGASPREAITNALELARREHARTTFLIELLG